MHWSAVLLDIFGRDTSFLGQAYFRLTANQGRGLSKRQCASMKHSLRAFDIILNMEMVGSRAAQDRDQKGGKGASGE